MTVIHKQTTQQLGSIVIGYVYEKCHLINTSCAISGLGHVILAAPSLA